MKAVPYQKTRKARAVCPDCGKELGVAPPADGDGTADVFPRHKNREGDRCDGGRTIVDYAYYVGAP